MTESYYYVNDDGSRTLIPWLPLPERRKMATLTPGELRMTIKSLGISYDALVRKIWRIKPTGPAREELVRELRVTGGLLRNMIEDLTQSIEESGNS